MKGIYSIRPSADFLKDLILGLQAEFGDAFGDSLILLPSRRACLDCRQQLLDACQPGMMIDLPRMLPIGEADCLSIGLVPPEPLRQAVDPLERDLIFAALIKAERRAAGGITDEHALRLSRELGVLLDELQTEEVDPAKLDDLVPEALASHWQRVLGFLTLICTRWPDILTSIDKIDVTERRRRALDQIANYWRENGELRPVIAAGMTGTIPAVARLLDCVAGLARGVIVLPGLDLAMDESSWSAVKKAPTHPQYGLARLLVGLDVSRADIRPWPFEAREASRVQSRETFWADVMRPAETSDLWRHSVRPNADAIDGMTRLVFSDSQEEAAAVALMIREAVEHPKKTVALVTPDRSLARAVTNRLQKFGIDATDSAGTPLDQTAPGSFVLLAARAQAERWSPLAALALLKHPLCCCGRDRTELRRLVRTLEIRLLHGPRVANGLSGLLHALRSRADQDDDQAMTIAALIEDLRTHTKQIDAHGQAQALDFAAMLEWHLVFCSWLASDQTGDDGALWTKAAGEVLVDFVERLRPASVSLGRIEFGAFPVLLALLMSAQTVRSERPGHPRVAILGQLESRLLAVDKVIIAGLQEGVWPRLADPSPWLSRSMRQSVGLPPADARIGIAAHDFFMSACRPEAVLTYARKDWQAGPATASRWLLRLETVLAAHDMAGALAPPKTADWIGWARALNKPDEILEPRQRPAPVPPIAARPRELSVTDVEMLIRDPYAFYARKVLALSALEPIDADPGAAERGVIIHQALERFVVAAAERWPADPLGAMIEIGEQLFAGRDHQPQIRAIWWPRFLIAAEWFIDIQAERREQLEHTLVELRGEIELRTQSGLFRLRARADRVELTVSGEINLIDYKTGNVPSRSDVEKGLSPQLTLTALIARDGGFKELGRRETSRMAYWALRGGLGKNETREPVTQQQYDALIEEARMGLASLIDYFNRAQNGYPAVPRPEIAPKYNDFDHLARTDEWRGQSMS